MGLVMMFLWWMVLSVVDLIDFEFFDIVVVGDDVDNLKLYFELYF